MSVASSLLFAPVWLIRWRRGKIQPASSVRLRLWPLLAAVSVAVFVLFMLAGMDEGRLRTAGLVSIVSGLLLLYVVRFT